MTRLATGSGGFAVVGGRLATDLLDVTSDPAALDSTGFWAVVLPFEGEPRFARFANVRTAPALDTVAPRQWRGPEPATWRTSLDREGYEKGVVAIREAISAGDVYEVNLCRVLSARLPKGVPEILSLAAELTRHNPAPHAATVSLPGHGIHLASASPELFLRRDSRAVESRPIKGTADAPAAFLPKDYAENVMIVDLVRNDLGRVCEWGSVEVPVLCSEEAHPGLVHLVSTVRGRLRRDAGWAELLDATFPPGSVTGAPKLAALEVIRRLEPVPRGLYCGSVGWVDADRRQGELNVAIRTFWVEDGTLHFGTGGAITWGSSPAGEWKETELKARRLLEAASG